MFTTKTGAIFSTNHKERFVLWRKWDHSKPNVLFIGLNPSKADKTKNDPTTHRIMAHSQRLGFGGCFLMNCFTHIATNPKDLSISGDWQQNLKWFHRVALLCPEVIFAWGKHGLVKKHGRDVFFKKQFPKAKCMGTNQDGSPRHPLYLSYATKLRQYSVD